MRIVNFADLQDKLLKRFGNFQEDQHAFTALVKRCLVVSRSLADDRTCKILYQWQMFIRPSARTPDCQTPGPTALILPSRTMEGP